MNFFVAHLKKIFQSITRFKDFLLELPPGYLEYRQAIISNDMKFNYLENEYFVKHVLPYNDNKFITRNLSISSRKEPLLVNENPVNQYRVNPVTGLPMIGAYDAAGNPFGFNYNQLNNNSNIINI